MKTFFLKLQKNLILLLFVFAFLNGNAQKSPEKAVQKLGPNPLFILDSVRVTRENLMAQDAEQVTYVQVLYDKDAIKQFGETAKDGVMIIETRSFARQKFTTYLRKKSLAYDSLLVKNGSDKGFVYILNDKIQKGNYEGNLSLIDDEIFERLEILNQAQLLEKYQISEYPYGVFIKSKKPKDLYHKNEKFK